jgi:uncharacterized protein (DUF342 family)
MIDFVELKGRLQPRLEADLYVPFVEATGGGLEEAVQEAATLLGLPVRRIEYEVVDRGFAGLFGKGARPWKIKAYASLAEIDEPDDIEESDIELAEELETEVVAIDGQAFVQFRKGDVLLKVTPPLGKGKPATDADAYRALKRRQILGYNDTLVKQVVKDAAGAYVLVARFQHEAANDSFARIEISEDEMFAYVFATPPGTGGGDLSCEGLKQLLRGNGVVYGIKEDFLVQFTDRPTYGTRVCVAEGKPAVNGTDARMEYYFEVDLPSRQLKASATGEVNFKELDLIQNVMAGDKLARKLSPEKGEHGRTVTGTLLPASDGKDIPLPLGENVSTDKDGVTIIANENGQAVLNAGKIGVEKVLSIDGSVGVKTGNIIFLGAVVVNGNVEEGYSIKATGNIEVKGLVDKADLDSEGEIIIKQGIVGKPGVSVRAGQMLVAKFIENATIKCGGTIIVSEGILNSSVNARQRVVCQGKRAVIIGGKICAGEEIQSKVIGSASGNTETICEVGYDPELKETIAVLTARQFKVQKDFDNLQRDITTLETAKKRQGEDFPYDKEEFLAELLERRISLEAKIDRVTNQIRKAKGQLAQVEQNGKVSVSAKCYPGVVIFIRDVQTVIRSEYKCVTFSASQGLIEINTFEGDGEKAPERKPQK